MYIPQVSIDPGLDVQAGKQEEKAREMNGNQDGGTGENEGRIGERDPRTGEKDRKIGAHQHIQPVLSIQQVQEFSYMPYLLDSRTGAKGGRTGEKAGESAGESAGKGGGEGVFEEEAARLAANMGHTQTQMFASDDRGRNSPRLSRAGVGAIEGARKRGHRRSASEVCNLPPVEEVGRGQGGTVDGDGQVLTRALSSEHGPVAPFPIRKRGHRRSASEALAGLVMAGWGNERFLRTPSTNSMAGEEDTSPNGKTGQHVASMKPLDSKKAYKHTIRHVRGTNTDTHTHTHIHTHKQTHTHTHTQGTECACVRGGVDPYVYIHTMGEGCSFEVRLWAENGA